MNIHIYLSLQKFTCESIQSFHLIILSSCRFGNDMVHERNARDFPLDLA